MVLGAVALCVVFYFRVRRDGGKEEGRKRGGRQGFFYCLFS
jgi:hypothetical protein